MVMIDIEQVEVIEEKVLITPDVEKIIKNLMATPLKILQMSAMTVGGAPKKSKTKELFFDEKGLHIAIESQEGLDKFIIPFDQLNRILGVVKDD